MHASTLFENTNDLKITYDVVTFARLCITRGVPRCDLGRGEGHMIMTNCFVFL